MSITSPTPASDTGSAPLDDEVAAFRAAYPDIGQIDVLIADTCGVLRGKKLPIEHLPKLYKDGLGFPGSIFATDITGSTVEETGLGYDDGDADRICMPVPVTLDPIPWLPRPTGQVLLSMRDHDGSPFFADPRTVLQNVMDRMAADGLFPTVAIELEFYLLDRDRDPSGAPSPPMSPLHGRRQSTTQVYGIEELYDFDALLDEIVQSCEAQDIPVDSTTSEYAPGQYEINLHHVDNALDACDDAVLFKRVVKGVAAKHGVEATFMAKPYPDLAGNGFHIHVSVRDRDGRNVFANDDPSGAPPLRHAIGGLAQTMPDGMAVFAPNQNSFRRFQPNSYAPHAPSWGVNNRSVSLRVPFGEPGSRRVEHRVAGADCNPYLVTAAVLAGIHHGIAERIEPGPPITGNAYEKLEPTLTSSWMMALDLLADSRFFADYFGKRFIEVYLALKWAERDKFFSMITPLEYEWYMTKV